MDEVSRKIRKVKEASYTLYGLDEKVRNKVLLSLAKELMHSSNTILQENAKDLALMSQKDPKYDRLLLTRERIQSIAHDITRIAALPSPVGTILLEKIMPNGLYIQKISVPLGVVGVIYESRPNVTLDVFALCFKSGNSCILKGGKEAYYSNTILAGIIKRVLITYYINPDVLYLMPTAREAIDLLLNAVNFVDVCIPRGGQALIAFVRNNAKVPVIETGAGIVHTYFDISGDVAKGRKIIENAKTRRASVCNALDTLVIHKKRLNDLQALVEPLIAKNVEIFADNLSYERLVTRYPTPLLHLAKPEDFGIEFLSYKMSIKTALSIEEAVKHIMHYTSGHSEAIIAEDNTAITYFLDNIDAAAVYANASTAFTDGGEFGMGAEIGISTQKLHVRGPMGLQELTSYKWLIFGDGHTRA
ncbi:Gamma-glutamyl phosphate reductase [Alphaproteobacteria bacterium]